MSKRAFSRSLLWTLVFAVPLQTFAQEDSRRLKTDIRRPLRIDYRSASWNKDPEKAESSSLLVRDAVSGRLAKVEVVETGADTGVFVGTYHMGFQPGAQANYEMVPEVFVVPAGFGDEKKGLSDLRRLISEGRLLRKPYFLRLENKNTQAISVYDTKEQALEAYQGYLKTGTGRQIVDRAAIEAAQASAVSAQARLRLEAEAKAEADRKRAADEEKLRQEALIAKQKALSEQEKAARKEQAKKFAEEATDLYRAGKYAQAEAKYQKASELDPENQTYFFQYGVTLFKQEKYDKSLVILNLAKGDGGSENERKYYIALNHLKKKEYNSAYQSLIEVKNINDETLSPAAAFFAGVIDFQNENYESSRGLFEYTLDHSKDPQIDKQAEAYIEQIANVMRFQEMQKQKFFINANAGLIFDSNILSIRPSDAPTNLEGWRLMYGGSVEYRPVYNQHHELSVALAVSDMYSMDKSFKAKTEFQNTDPLIAKLTLPYRWKSEAFGKGYQLSLTPGFESILMNADGQGARENILNSTVLDIDQTFVMNQDWFSTYTVQLRRDNSMTVVGEDENQSASKITLSSSQMWFQDAKKTTVFIWDLGLALNSAEGRNQRYNRIDTAATYMAPISTNWTGTTRLGYYTSNYKDSSTGRKDDNYSLTLAGRRPLDKLLFLNLGFTYMSNKSLPSFTYDKYMASASVSWDQNF